VLVGQLNKNWQSSAFFKDCAVEPLFLAHNLDKVYQKKTIDSLEKTS
jgi:hypothetical protein